MPTELATTNYFNMDVWKAMDQMAKTFLESKALPSGITNTAQLMLIFQAGHELGMKPVESLRNLYIVKGRVSMQGSAMLKKMQQAGVVIRWEEVSAEKVKAVFKRQGHEPFTAEYTMQQARERKLDMNYDYQTKEWKKKPTWHSFPENMLRWKVLAIAGKFYCADIIEGTELYEDIVDVVTVEGASDEKIVEGKEEVVIDKEERTKTFDDLLSRTKRVRSKSGAEKIKKEIQEGSFSDTDQRFLINTLAQSLQNIDDEGESDDKPGVDEVLKEVQDIFTDEKPPEGGKLKDLFGKKK